MVNEESENGRGGYQIVKIMRKKRGYSKCVHVRTQGDMGRIERSIIRSARTKWMAPNKCHGIILVHWSGQVPYSISTSKEYVVVSFHQNISCMIVLSYAIIMIIETYSIILIYLQVSKTEVLTELHQAKCMYTVYLIYCTLSVSKKINSVCFQRISLILSRIRCPPENQIQSLDVLIIQKLERKIQTS